jgi:hypothetical protein
MGWTNEQIITLTLRVGSRVGKGNEGNDGLSTGFTGFTGWNVSGPIHFPILFILSVFFCRAAATTPRLRQFLPVLSSAYWRRGVIW